MHKGGDNGAETVLPRCLANLVHQNAHQPLPPDARAHREGLDDQPVQGFSLLELQQIGDGKEKAATVAAFIMGQQHIPWVNVIGKGQVLLEKGWLVDPGIEDVLAEGFQGNTVDFGEFFAKVAKIDLLPGDPGLSKPGFYFDKPLVSRGEIVGYRGKVFMPGCETGLEPKLGPLRRVLRLHQKRGRAIRPGDEPVWLPGVSIHRSIDCGTAVFPEQIAGRGEQLQALLAVLRPIVANDAVAFPLAVVPAKPDAATALAGKQTRIRSVLSESFECRNKGQLISVEYFKRHEA